MPTLLITTARDPRLRPAACGSRSAARCELWASRPAVHGAGLSSRRRPPWNLARRRPCRRRGIYCQMSPGWRPGAISRCLASRERHCYFNSSTPVGAPALRDVRRAQSLLFVSNGDARRRAARPPLRIRARGDQQFVVEREPSGRVLYERSCPAHRIDAEGCRPARSADAAVSGPLARHFSQGAALNDVATTLARRRPMSASSSTRAREGVDDLRRVPGLAMAGRRNEANADRVRAGVPRISGRST